MIAISVTLKTGEYISVATCHDWTMAQEIFKGIWLNGVNHKAKQIPSSEIKEVHMILLLGERNDE